MTKKQLADKLGYEYLGKGLTPCGGEEGFIIRKYGTTQYKVIGNTQAETYDWLVTTVNQDNY